MSLSNTVKAIQDIMRKDAGVDGDAQRIGQLGWMLFLKIYSDLELETELEDTKYKSPIPKKFRWESWADEGVAGKDSLTGDALINFVNNELFPKLKELDLSSFSGQARERGALLISVFDDAYNYMKNGTLLRQVINKLNQDIDYNSVETRHLFGDIYEQILRDLQNAGNAGEYYTPRAVTQFAIEMVNPRLGEIVLDPACGTGGFLTGAFEHMKKQVETPAELKVLKNSIRGVEKKPLPHVLCATNMMVHGIEVPSNIINDNTLAKPIRDYGKKDQVDVIITNPPFGGIEEDGIENNFPAEFRTKETADLFLVLVMELLKDGGRAAIVLPDGTLFGEGVKTKIKKKMLEECNLHTIVRLPKSVFAPYTTIATNVLFLTKGEPTKDIWYFEHRLPSGVKAYNKTKPMQHSEFNLEKSWWENRTENPSAWKVPVQQIIDNNYNLDIRNPRSSDDVFIQPNLLLDELFEKTQVKEQTLGTLKIELQKLLSNHSESAIFLTENLELNLESHQNIKSLKQVILKIAMNGEMPHETLDKDSFGKTKKLIEKGFASRIQKGELPNSYRKEKLEIVNKEGPYELPESWFWLNLSDVGAIVGGGTPSTTNASYWSESQEIPWITPADMRGQNQFEIASGRRHITSKGLENSSAQLLPVRTVLFSSRAPIGHVGITSAPLATNQGFKSCIPFADEMCEWIFYFLLHAGPEIDSKATGTTFREVSGKQVASILIPCPPIETQIEILTKVKSIFILCEKLENLHQELTELKKAFSESVYSKLLR